MRRPLRDQRGFTLVELLMAMTLSLVVFGATLAVAAALSNNARRTAEHNEAQDQARTYQDRLARQLRNLASPSSSRRTTRPSPTRSTPRVPTTSCSAWWTKPGPPAA